MGDSSGQQHAQLLHELILLDVEYRFRKGEKPSRDEYRQRFPQHGDLISDLSSDRPQDTRPEQIGPYKILEVLGEGGMGVVYLAEQREPVRRRVALKLIKLGMDTKEVIARFEAERQALAVMDHANIARIHDAGATKDGRPYFSMEPVEGIPITDYCDRHRLSIPERLRLFLQVCNGVGHAHHRGIIHRDIKDSNILVDRWPG